MKNIYLIIFISLVACNDTKVKGDEKLDFSTKFEDLVYNEKNINEEYFLKINKKSGVLEYKVTYIGKIQDKRNNNIDFLYSTIYTGNYEDSKRASSALILYLNDKRYGMYQVAGGFDKAPVISQNEILISYNDNDDCDQSTLISFRDSIPKYIFVHCNEENGRILGDLFKFEKIEIISKPE